MKKRMPILLFSLLSITMFSQNLEFSAQFYSESYGQRVLSMPNGKWFFAGKIYPGLWEEKEYTVIYGAIDQNGGLFPFSPIENFDNSNVLSLFQKEGGNFLIGAEDVECGQATNGTVYEIDDEGEIAIMYDLNMECQSFLDIKDYQGNVFVSCASGISQIYNNGNVVPKVTSIDGITAFIPLYNDWFLIGNSEQTTNFHGVTRVDEFGEVVTTLDISGGGPILQMMSLGFDRNVILQEKNVYLVNDNLTIIEDLSVQSINIEFLRFSFDADGIWILGRDLDKNIIVYGFDYDLALQENFSVPGLGLEALDIAIKGEDIALVGTGHSGMYLDTLAGTAGSFVAGNNFWIKTFDKEDMSNFSTADVGLEEVTAASPTFFDMEYTCNGVDMIQGYEAEIADLEIKITNNGMEDLHHVVANIHIVACPSSCNYDTETLVQETYENLNLAPGESIWLPFPTFEAIFHEHDLPQVCMWLSTPNQKVDQNPSDNVFCKYFFDTTTATDDITFDMELNIFPNPAADILNLNMNQPLDFEVDLLIVNAVGQVINQAKMDKGATNVQLDTEQLPTGVYFLQLEKEGRTLKVLRFLKD